MDFAVVSPSRPRRKASRLGRGHAGQLPAPPLSNALHERARVHLRQGGARAQPQVRHPRDPEEEAGGLHRGLRLGQVLARLRHPLRRGAAPLRRVALLLRPAVPRADGEAEVRHHPRPLAHHLHRAEGGLEQPALDGRHHHRGRTTTCACSTRPSACSTARAAAGRWASRRRSRSSTRSRGCRRARASCSSRRWSRTARASTATSSPTSASAASPGCGWTGWSTSSPSGSRSTRS